MLSRLVSLPLAVALAGCGLGTEPTESLEFTVSVNHTTMRLGETMYVYARVVNRGADTARIECGLAFEVRAAGGDIVVPAEGACALMASSRTIAPGDSLAQRFDWYADVRRVPGVSYGPFSEGSYEVRGVLPLGGSTRLSEPVLIELLPRS